jgi:aquaporin Z
MAYSIGNISGCHINPAVTLAVLINKGIGAKDALFYMLSQVLGGIFGALLLGLVAGFDHSFGANGLYQDSIGISLLVEIILTFIFVLAILGVTSKPEFSNVAGLVIGLSLTLVHIFGIHFTGTSVNPARSLASAVFNMDAMSSVWVFIVGPFAGAALAAFCWKFLKADEK